MWRERIRNLTNSAVFHPPAGAKTLSDLSSALQVDLPGELRELLAESNGIDGEFGQGLVWNCERILKDNIMFRTYGDFAQLYMTFDPMFFFADAGNGDQFAFAIPRDGKIRRQDIFVWNHENDSRTWVAPSLERYLDWWLTGKINV